MPADDERKYYERVTRQMHADARRILADRQKRFGREKTSETGDKQMNTVSKEDFDAFVDANCPMHVRAEPRVEHDINVSYDCYDNDDGEEIAFAEWRDGTATYYAQGESR